MREKRILIIDDEKDILKILAKKLSTVGYLVFGESDGEHALEAIKRVIPDLILLDIKMPRIDGLQVKARLNEDSSAAYIPVIFLTVKDAISDKIKGFYLGADDYITKPFNPEELLARIDAILRKREFYENISMTDGLTGLYNVNFFKKNITLFFNIARRYKKIFSLVIIDIDNFKDINDTYGHLAGDFVLKTFSSIAKWTFRRSDLITRYGGDEFTIIMPETNNEQAAKAIERLKDNINGKVFTFHSSQIKLTFSISTGIATYDDSFIDESNMFGLADLRLYEDKKK